MTLRHPDRVIVTACVIGICICCNTVKARSQTRGSADADAHRFYRTLTDGLASGNRRQVAELFRYPLQVRVLGLSSRLVAVKDAAAMVQMYPLFLGPQFRCRIEQPPLIVDGLLSMADGQVIAQRIDGVFRITRLTVSLEAPARAAPPIPVFLSLSGKRQFGGRLVQDGVDTYVVAARSGERLSVSLERFPGRALGIRVYNQRTRHTLNGAAEYARVWRARIPEDGDYVVEIQRRVPYCSPEVTYLITLALH